MATLTNTKIKDTYPALLKASDNGVIGATEKVITDGLGNDSVLKLGTASASFTSDIEVNTLTIGLGSGSIATNTALGLDALLSNTTGSGNVSVGQGSLRANTTGSTNVAVGKDSLRANTTGGSNTALGYFALYDNTNGESNVAVGRDALNANTTGSNTVAIGRGSMSDATSGNDNTAVGFYSLVNNEASKNTAIGHFAMLNNTTGAWNTAVGAASLYENTEGQNNVAVGYNSANSNTTGNYNTALGSAALYANETSGNNTALGYHALRNNTAANNTAIGSGALFDNTTGGSNVAIGKDALKDNTTGGSNTSIGTSAIAFLNGTDNVAIGQSAGANTTGALPKTAGSQNTYVGAGIRSGAADTTNEIVIGYNTFGNGSNTATYGNSSITNHHFTAGQVNVSGNLAVDTNTLYVDAANNRVGINKTPSVELDIIGSGKIQVQSGATNNTAPSSLVLSNITTGAHASGVGSSLQFEFFNTSGGFAGSIISSEANADPNTSDLVFKPRNYGNAEAMRIDSSGRVGIGTSSPAAAMHIIGADEDQLRLGTAETEWYQIGRDTSGGLLHFYGSQSGYTGYVFGGVNGERMRIDSSGRVGIGTSSPANTLDVQAAQSTIRIKSTTGTNANWLNVENTAGSFFVGRESSSGASFGASNYASILYSQGAYPMEFFTNSQKRMVIDSSGRVGIGTSSPATQLNIAKDSADVEVRLSTTTSGNVRLGMDASGAVYNWIQTDRSSSAMQFAIANAERMRIDSSGNVGIGTSTTTAKLDTISSVTGAYSSGTQQTVARFFNKMNDGTASSAFLSLQVSSDNEGSNPIARIGVVAESAGSNNGAFVVATRDGSGISERMRIDSSGNVGIGTSSVNAKLEIAQSTDNTDGPSLRISNLGNTLSNGQLIGALEFYNGDDSGGGNNVGCSIKSICADAVSPVSSDYLVFNAGGNTERMRIDSSGNVGIGTSATSAKLQIANTNAGAGAVALFLNNVSTSLNTETRLAFAANTNDDISTNRYSYISALNTSGSNGQALVFATNPTGAAATERMRITSGGNVLIGTTSFAAGQDSQQLEPVGARVSSRSATTSQFHNVFYNPNGVIGSITTSGSATQFNTSSDYRLKENIVEMTGALDRVDALKPSRFNFIADPEKTVDGFLAHEVQAIVPEAVTGEKDAVDEEGNPIYQGIDQSKIVPLLVGAIKELKAEIELLKSQLS